MVKQSYWCPSHSRRAYRSIPIWKRGKTRLCLVTNAVQHVWRNDHADIRVWDTGTCRLHHWRKIGLEFRIRGRHDPNCKIMYSRVKLWTNDTWTQKKLQESVLWYFLALTYLENNISKVDTNRRTRKCLKVTLKLFNIQQLKSFIVQLPSISFP